MGQRIRRRVQLRYGVSKLKRITAPFLQQARSGLNEGNNLTKHYASGLALMKVEDSRRRRDEVVGVMVHTHVVCAALI